MYRGYCRHDKQVLFDVPDFEAFHKPAPVRLECRHCGRVYNVSQDKNGDVVYKLKGSSIKKPPVKAEKYG